MFLDSSQRIPDIFPPRIFYRRALGVDNSRRPLLPDFPELPGPSRVRTLPGTGIDTVPDRWAALWTLCFDLIFSVYYSDLVALADTAPNASHHMEVAEDNTGNLIGLDEGITDEDIGDDEDNNDDDISEDWPSPHWDIRGTTPDY